MKHGDHEEHHHDMHNMGINPKDDVIEYFKFSVVMFMIIVFSYGFWIWTDVAFVDSFMGVFFVVFALFKFKNYKEFAYGFQSYDVVAKNSLAYSYSYPILQLLFGVTYLLGYGTLILDLAVVVVSLVSSVGVIKSLAKKSMVHCVCLGGVIKLPLSTISFVEDFGMAIMAGAMILMR